MERRTGKEHGNYYHGLYRDYYKDPFLRTVEDAGARGLGVGFEPLGFREAHCRPQCGK